MIVSPSLKLVLGLLLVTLVTSVAWAQTVDLARLKLLNGRADKALSIYKSSGKLDTYFAEYHKVLEGREYTPITSSVMKTLLSTAQCVMMGDNHVAIQSQDATIEFLHAMAHGKGKITVVLEWIDKSHQKKVEEYLAKPYDETNEGEVLTQLRKDVNYDEGWSFSWESYSRILIEMKELKASVLLTDDRIEKPGIRQRDIDAGKMICDLHKKKPAERFLIVYGETHMLGEKHLSEQMVIGGFQPDIITNGKNDKLFWEAVAKYKNYDKMRYLDLGDLMFEEAKDPYKTTKLVYVLAGDPVERKRALLKYYAAERAKKKASSSTGSGTKGSPKGDVRLLNESK